ncbi:MAG: hypothetical protein P1Q69_05545 [Candidatus Thorarchaeota archaeon]|nr:hypothetical protein [Candidatus Thorarchaeota archaeon]
MVIASLRISFDILVLFSTYIDILILLFFTSDLKIDVSGDEEAMLPNTIDELSEMIDAWVCINCGGELNADQILLLASGKVFECKFCKHTLSADIYERDRKTIRPKLIDTTLSSEMVYQADLDVNQVAILEDASGQSAKVSRTETGRYAILRGYETIGGRFIYKVKVMNNTEYVVTNVTISIVSYPRDCLNLESEISRFIPRIEGNGFRSLEFELLPTKDCVEGKITSTVSLVDMKDNLQSLPVKEVVLRSVCDLLKPLETQSHVFETILGDLSTSSEDINTNWNVRILSGMMNHILPSKNFYIIDSTINENNGETRAVLRGFAEGKYTKKRVAAVLTITGATDGSSSNVKIEILGDDLSMIPTALVELKESLWSWVCLGCGGKLVQSEVLRIKGGHVVSCQYCGASLSKELYIL